MEKSLLTIIGLSVSSGGARLLDGADLDVAPGELVAVCGPSGCGKTTFLRAVAGLTDPDEGQAFLRGRAPGDIGWPRFRRQVVMVEQRPVLLDGSVMDNLKRPFAYRSSRGSYPEERARTLLTELRIEPERYLQNARSLSEGQRQRVCLVRALLPDPAVLLLDEPTSALDKDAAEAVEGLVRREAAARGMGALVVTHDRDRAQRWCDRIAGLEWLGASPGARPEGGADG